MRAGLIGLGAIGSGIVRFARSRPDDGIEIVAALVADRARPRSADAPPLVYELRELLDLRPDVIVDAAGHSALRAHGPGVVAAGIDLIILSVGALADDQLRLGLRSAAQASGARVRVASGAIAGLDGLSAAALDGLERVTHTVRKPPRALLGDAAAGLTEPRELYYGSAREGVARFPENANVVAAISLAGLGLDRTEMRVIADPGVTRNTHVVTADGAFGSLRIEIQNVPSQENPRTARLAAMSAYTALLERRSSLRIG
jgi:aspartate dehydrogenase